MSENEIFDGIEIPDGLLEGVAGGKLTPNNKIVLTDIMKKAKAKRWSCENLIGYLEDRFSHPTLTEYLIDAIGYVRDNWDSVSLER